MKRIILLICVITNIFFCKSQNFPIADLDEKLDSKNPKVVVFMPSISGETPYASMIVQAFKNYFVDKLAFTSEERDKANVDIILVTNRNQEKKLMLPTYDQNLFQTEGMHIYYRFNEKLINDLNLPKMENPNDDSVLFLLNGNNEIVWRDDHYRGQGEHLKPLEYKIKDLLSISYPKIIENKTVSLKTGDLAPSINLGDKKISDYKKNILVLTFYPAAYSGVFDTQNMILRQRMERMMLVSCAIQITSFDKMSKNINHDVKYFSISESTPELLENWKNALNTTHIEYINDSDYSISQTFGSYNPEGYNNRMTVIIDKNGKIVYIDKDYKLSKDAEIEKIIQKLQKS